jgi:hypothetical protein
LQRLEQQAKPLYKDSQGLEEFLQLFSACWQFLDLYGKKTEEFQMLCAQFTDSIKDLPGSKVIRAMKHYRDNETSFPKPSQIRKMVEDMSFTLTKQEEEFSLMHSRARTRNMAPYLLDDQKTRALELYEKKYGEINHKIKWVDAFVQKFGDLESKNDA